MVEKTVAGCCPAIISLSDRRADPPARITKTSRSSSSELTKRVLCSHEDDIANLTPPSLGSIVAISNVQGCGGSIVKPRTEIGSHQQGAYRPAKRLLRGVKAPKRKAQFWEHYSGRWQSPQSCLSNISTYEQHFYPIHPQMSGYFESPFSIPSLTSTLTSTPSVYYDTSSEPSTPSTPCERF